MTKEGCLSLKELGHLNRYHNCPACATAKGDLFVGRRDTLEFGQLHFYCPRCGSEYRAFFLDGEVLMAFRLDLDMAKGYGPDTFHQWLANAQSAAKAKVVVERGLFAATVVMLLGAVAFMIFFFW